MTTIRRIARNSAVTFSAEIVNKIIGLILTIIIARYLGDAGFEYFVQVCVVFQRFVHAFTAHIARSFLVLSSTILMSRFSGCICP